MEVWELLIIRVRWQNVNSQVVTLNSITSSPGEHVLTIFSTNPNGVADQFTGNDTIRKIVKISPCCEAPVSEGFETTTFPPANWSIENPDGLITWDKNNFRCKNRHRFDGYSKF